MKYTYFYNRKPVEKSDIEHLLTERFSLEKIEQDTPDTTAFIYTDKATDDEIKIVRKNHTLRVGPFQEERTDEKYQYFLNDNPIGREHFKKIMDDSYNLHDMKDLGRNCSEFIYRHLATADQLRIRRAGRSIKIL